MNKYKFKLLKGSFVTMPAILWFIIALILASLLLTIIMPIIENKKINDKDKNVMVSTTTIRIIH